MMQFHQGLYFKTKASSAFSLMLIALMLLTYVFAGFIVNPVKVLASDSSVPATPVSGDLGTVFSIKGSGFTTGEYVTFWTRDPNNATLPAGYTYADQNGNFEVRIDTKDPLGLTTAISNNYTAGSGVILPNGTYTNPFLRVVLYKPFAGNWYLTSLGKISGVSQDYSFTISSGPPGNQAVSAPAAAFPVGGTITPTAAAPGATFSIYANGFLSGEKINFWTSTPSGTNSPAGFYFAGKDGTFNIRIQTSDPLGLANALGANYSAGSGVLNQDGSYTDPFLKIILYKPVAGDWVISAHGLTSGAIYSFTFSITQSQ